MSNKFIDKKKVKIIKTLLEKYSKKKVVFKEFDGDEFFYKSDEDIDAEIQKKPFKLYSINDKEQKNLIGGYDSFERAQRSARRSYLNVEKENARYEDREINRNPPMTDQAIPEGYYIEEK